MNGLYHKHSFLAESDYDSRSFQWINCHDADNSVFSFVRFGQKPEEILVVVASFTPVPRHYRVGVPREGFWVEVLNTNSRRYGGNDEGNSGGANANPIGWNGRPFALDVNLPGMTTLYFVPASAAADPVQLTEGQAAESQLSQAGAS